MSNINEIVKKETYLPERVLVFDTTLRDGEQTPGVSLRPEDKIRIAKKLDELGVDIIEAGFPAVSEGEKEAFRKLVDEGLVDKLCGLSRCRKEDIDAVIDCDLSYIHLFIATSDIHLKYKLGISREEAIDRAIRSIEYAKDHGLYIEFSAEDATRTDLDFLKKFYNIVVNAGADKINVPDTVGTVTPRAMFYLIKELRESLEKKVPISVHCHNDFGLATANTLAGVEAGAEQVHVTVNGIGERAGNAALEEVIMSLVALYGVKTNIKTELIYQTSELVRSLTGVPLQPHKAIVGENAFAHESGIHVHGVLKEAATYEPIRPEMVGHRRRIVIGKHAGSHGIREKLKEMGVEVTEDQLREIVKRVKEIGDMGKTITDADLRSIAEAVIGGVPPEERVVRLEELVVVTGTNVTPTASVRIAIDSEERRAAEIGVGPVDAALKAIQKAVGEIANVQLREFRLNAITGGSDALAEVTVKVADDRGNLVLARGVKPDIVMASVDAMVEGINKLFILKKKAR